MVTTVQTSQRNLGKTLYSNLTRDLRVLKPRKTPMHTASMSFGRPHRGSHRISTVLAGAVAGLLGWMRRIDRWMLERGHEEPKTRAEVLEWAHRLERSDPGFAADLRAAAFRDSD